MHCLTKIFPGGLFNDMLLFIWAELFDAELTWETESFWRYRKLSDLVAAHGRPFTADDLKVLHTEASFPKIFQLKTAGARDGGPRGVGSTGDNGVRTLWHCLFDQETGTVAYRFYLGDEMTDDGCLEARRSDYLTLTLEDARPRIIGYHARVTTLRQRPM